MPVQIRYGRGALPVELDSDWDVQVLHLNPLPVLEDAPQQMDNALRSPIGSQPLDVLARGRESACIVISDVTRPVPNELILTPVLECLHDCGLSEAQISILVATGLHRPNEGAELEEMIGARIAKRYKVLNHFARDTKTQTSLGEIPLGEGQDTPPMRSAEVSINSAYVQSDLKITTGLIEPHLMAGYSGGRKLVCPGIASADTILQFHNARMIGHPNAHAGNLRQNPVHLMSRAVAGRVGVDFICNVTLSEDRRTTGIFCGDLDAAHNAGIAHVDQQTKVPCRVADIVLTSGAGYPLDTSLYQVIKGMVGALPAVKQGGTIIIAASMSEGLGGAEFSQMCRELTSVEAFMERIYNSPVEIDQWQLQEMMQVLQKCEVMIVTQGLDSQVLADALLTPMPDIQTALQAAFAKHGHNATLTVIPEGPYVTPMPEFAEIAR